VRQGMVASETIRVDLSRLKGGVVDGSTACSQVIAWTPTIELSFEPPVVVWEEI
jgi:hypothetical protein